MKSVKTDKSNIISSYIDCKYSNYFKVGYNDYEFILDFSRYHEGDKETKSHTIIVTNPKYAKAFLEVLHKSINQYEKAYGEIYEIGGGDE